MRFYVRKCCKLYFDGKLMWKWKVVYSELKLLVTFCLRNRHIAFKFPPGSRPPQWQNSFTLFQLLQNVTFEKIRLIAWKFQMWSIYFFSLLKRAGHWYYRPPRIGRFILHQRTVQFRGENDIMIEMKMISYLCFICTISSLFNPLIFSCLFKSLTESVTRSSSVIPHWNGEG